MPSQEPPSYIEQKREEKLFDQRREQHLERPLPSSEDSERVVLGAVLLDNDLIAEVAAQLQPEQFYSPFNKRVYDAMLKLFSKQIQIDPIMIIEEMKREGPVEALGGISMIANLTYGLPPFTVTGLQEYISVIVEKFRARSLLRLCNQVTSEVLAEEDDIDVVLERAEHAMHELSDSGSQDAGAVDAHQLAVEVIHHASEVAHNPGMVVGLSTGFSDLDTALLGLQPSDLIIIGARPSMGKTALALDVLRNVAFYQGETGMMFSLEMSRQQLMMRLICADAGVRSNKMRLGTMTADEWERVHDARARFENGKLLIDDTPMLTTVVAHRKVRRVAKSHKMPAVIVIDYLGLMVGDYTRGLRYESRQVEVSRISRELKLMAKEFQIPVVALCQLNRQPENRAANNHRPNLGDLRESGAIEQDADVVAFIYREEMYPKPDGTVTGHGEAEVIIAKQRNGPIGTVRLHFDKDLVRFGNLQQQF